MICDVDSHGTCSDKSCTVPDKLPTRYSDLITVRPSPYLLGPVVNRRSKGCLHYSAGVYRGTTPVNGRLRLPDISEAEMGSSSWARSF